jgi:hypothetical protein
VVVSFILEGIPAQIETEWQWTCSLDNTNSLLFRVEKMVEICEGAKGLEGEDLKILLVLMDRCKSTLGRMILEMVANGGENNKDWIFKFERLWSETDDME